MHQQLTLPYPPSANRYWRMFRGRMVKSSQARSYQEEVKATVTGDLLPGDVGLTLMVYRPKRIGDLDNTLKVLIDALKTIVYNDDSQVKEIHARLMDDKTNPRVEVEVREI